MSTGGRSREPKPSHLLARLAVAHALLLIVFLSWRFGGMEPWARKVSGWLCVPAPFLTWLAWRQADQTLRRHFSGVVVPLLAIVLMVLASLLNPNMRVLFSDGQPAALINRDFMRFLPSTPLPRDAAADFFLNAGLILVGLNLFITRPARAVQRVLLAAIAINAAVLACIGSVFKLGHAAMILGRFPSPNPRFFATFFYYNHWGAFAVLGAAAAAGLALHYYDRAPEGRWQHTPAPLFGVLTILLVLSLLLGAGRGPIAIGLIFALGLLGRIALRALKSRQGQRAKLATIAGVLGGVAAASLWLAQDSLRVLLHKTAEQVTTMRAGKLGEMRLPLYRDTWKLVEQRPIFGWGWHSFRYAFRQVQSFDARMENEQKAPSVFLDAHNDWLQLLAELGLMGGALGIATLVGIARTASARQWQLSPAFEITLGVGCVGLLALVDFPFACPAVVVTAWALLLTGAAIAFDRTRPVVTA